MLGLGTLCLLLLCASVAGATDREADGRALFEVGVKSYQEGQYAAAIAAFSEAYRITKRPGLLFSLAQAFRRNYDKTHEPTQLQEAIQYYTRYLAANASGEHRTEAAAWLQQLSPPKTQGVKPPPRAEQGRTQLVIAVNVPHASLRLDGRSIPTLPYAADVAPGKHHLEVTADGYALYQQDVDVAEDTVLPINLELVRSISRIEVLGASGAEVLIDGVKVGELPSDGFAVVPGHHAVEVRRRGYYTLRHAVESSAGVPQTLRLTAAPTTRRTASWVLVGAGAAATLAGSLLGYLAVRKQADAQSLQDQPGMGPAFERALGARNDLRLAAAVTAGTGAATAVAGLISIVTEGFGPTRPLPSASRTASLHAAAVDLGAVGAAVGVGLAGAF